MGDLWDLRGEGEDGRVVVSFTVMSFIKHGGHWNRSRLGWAEFGEQWILFGASSV